MNDGNTIFTRIRRTAISSAVISFVATLGAPTFAADSAPLEEILVSGSRLASTSGFSTPTPVSTLDGGEIERLNITNIGAGLNQLPAFRPSTTPTTNGWGS